MRTVIFVSAIILTSAIGQPNGWNPSDELLYLTGYAIVFAAFADIWCMVKGAK